MKQVAEDVWQLRGFPPNAINVYLVGDVLVDAATRYARRRIVGELAGYRVSAHTLTHAHPDHQGASHAVCQELGLPLWCGEADADAMEDPRLIRARQPSHPVAQFFDRACTGPGHSVSRQLREGDEVAGFRVLHTPGHSAGHISLWRESDRVLVLGDVLLNQHPFTGVPGLREPADYFTPDPARNRESVRRLATLEPALVCFGHGAPLRDTRRFVEFASALPA